MSPNKAKRDLLSLYDLDREEIYALLRRAARLKVTRGQAPAAGLSLAGKSLAMIFEKSSTRTRVSFEVAMAELGGHAVYLAPDGSQLGRGEPIKDTARVLGRYCHAIMMRTFGQDRCDELAKYSPVPVINGLTDDGHPCQVLTDLFTVYERTGAEGLRTLRYAWVGDGNNMAASWLEAAAIMGFELVLACPKGYTPREAALAAARSRGARIRITDQPEEAVEAAQVVSTDVWASMGQEAEAAERARAFAGFTLDERLLAKAADSAIVLHCLPAHRGEEISEAVMEGPLSAIFDQAENRLHVQKSILETLILG